MNYLATPRSNYCIAAMILAVSAGTQAACAESEAKASTIGRESTSVPADQPLQRSDANSQIAHAELLEKAKQGRIDVYFVGDSITRRWGTSDDAYREMLANWNENFFGWNAANFGWGGDTTQNILWRLHNGELDRRRAEGHRDTGGHQ